MMDSSERSILITRLETLAKRLRRGFYADTTYADWDTYLTRLEDEEKARVAALRMENLLRQQSIKAAEESLRTVRVCAFCGNVFHNPRRSTCGDECAEELSRQRNRERQRRYRLRNAA